eukprot:5046333-Pyramimonas_sp.AAC.1
MVSARAEYRCRMSAPSVTAECRRRVSVPSVGAKCRRRSSLTRRVSVPIVVDVGGLQRHAPPRKPNAGICPWTRSARAVAGTSPA